MGRRWWLVAMALALVVGSILAVVLETARISMEDHGREDFPFSLPVGPQRHTLFLGALLILAAAWSTLLATMHRAAGRTLLSSPVFTCFSWFIPIGQLFLPVLVVSQIARHSKAPVRFLVWLWGAAAWAYVVASVATVFVGESIRYAATNGVGGADFIIVTPEVWGFLCLLAGGAALLFATVVWLLTLDAFALEGKSSTMRGAVPA